MNFEVASQEGLPAGWYVTGDGYPVAQVRPNHWVYGTSGQAGVLVPTEVAVGAVVPMNLPQLARAAVFSGSGRVYGMEKFRTVTKARVDNMGVLNDSIVYTPVAWKSGEAGLQVWLGDRWYRVVPSSGQNTYQAFMYRHPFIVRTLEKKNTPWTMYDTEELADLAREWGFLWHGQIRFTDLPKDSNRETGSDGGQGGTRNVGIGGRTPSSGGGSHWQGGGGSSSGSGGNNNSGGDRNWN